MYPEVGWCLGLMGSIEFNVKNTLEAFVAASVICFIAALVINMNSVNWVYCNKLFNDVKLCNFHLENDILRMLKLGT